MQTEHRSALVRVFVSVPRWALAAACIMFTGVVRLWRALWSACVLEPCTLGLDKQMSTYACVCDRMK